jgi:decaprenylphospho-beta-D-erythro-pentofuranosid-2-ulose 2-reductase
MSAATQRRRRLLVLGGSSEIAQAIAHELLGEGVWEIVLAGRDAERLDAAARRLRDRGCRHVQTLTLQACSPEDHEAAVARAFARLGEVDLALIAVGVLGERGGVPADIAAAYEVLEVNLAGAGSLLLHCAARMRAQGRGTIAVLSSVAAVRPRAANAVYCASKAGLDALARGVGDALAPSGVRVMVIRPGFVATRMTDGLRRPPLTSTPEAVARATARGLARGAQTVWVPATMRWVALALAVLPRALRRRLPL